MALNQEQLNKFREQKERLGSMLADSADVISELNMTSASDNLSKLSEKVNNDTFKIQVVGTFKNGKSTFINSLLGEAVLPAYSRPCTAVINEVKYGENKEAVLYFRNPLPDKIPDSISSKAMNHMKTHGMVNIPPLKIGYDEIKDYVCIPMGGDPQEMLLESPYEKVELFWPLDILKEGVEIIDSPGLDEAETRTRVTMDYLSKADAILFVLTADKLCSQAEMDFIENNLKDYGFTDPFFIVNRFDLIRDKEKNEIREFAKMKLSEFTTNEIFYVSAQDALDGEVEHDKALYEKSNMSEFTSILSDFLTKDKGKIKLSQPARELKRILNTEALYKIIPGQRTMLECSLDDVKARYEKAKPQLVTLKDKKKQIISSFLLLIEQSKQEFKRASNRNMLSMSEMIPVWINEFEPKSKFNVIPTKKKTTVVVSEISEFVTKKIQEQQSKWKKEVLQPLVEEKAQYIFKSAERDLTNLYNDIDSLNIQISGRRDVNPDNVPLWQRIAGAAGGILIGDLGLAFSGGVNGISKDLAKTAAFEVGAGAILYLIGALNPFTLVAILLAAIIHSWHAGVSTAMRNTKDLVSNEIVTQIVSTADESSSQLADSISEKLHEIANGISCAIDNEIKQTEQQVNGIIKEMEKGQSNINARKRILDACEDKIKGISSNLDIFTFDLIEQK